MNSAEPSLPDKIVAIHDALDAATVPHAFGGALALAYYAEPRSTIDIDVNVFVTVGRAETVFRAIVPLGVDGSSIRRKELERDGQARVWWGRTPLDLFFAYDPLHEAMNIEARSVPFGANTIRILAPEHLMVCKVIFSRRKDWLDIEQMLLAVDDLDVPDVRVWVERVVGEGDDRLVRLSQAVDEILGAQ